MTDAKLMAAIIVGAALMAVAPVRAEDRDNILTFDYNILSPDKAEPHINFLQLRLVGKPTQDTCMLAAKDLCFIQYHAADNSITFPQGLALKLPDDQPPEIAR